MIGSLPSRTCSPIPYCSRAKPKISPTAQNTSSRIRESGPKYARKLSRQLRLRMQRDNFTHGTQVCRQNHRFKRVQQHGENDQDAENGGEQMHGYGSDEGRMVTDSGCVKSEGLRRAGAGKQRFQAGSYGVACAFASPFCTASSSFSTPRSLRESSALAPSDFASFGLSCTSRKTPSTPAATAARASTGMNSGWPPLVALPPFSSPCEAEGSCTEWVASKTTGANLRMMASERMSTTRLL